MVRRETAEGEAGEEGEGGREGRMGFGRICNKALQMRDIEAHKKLDNDTLNMYHTRVSAWDIPGRANWIL